MPARLLAATAFFFLCAQSAWAQSEIIRGRVYGPDSLPLPQAEVLVTGLVSQAVQTTRTDAKGVYTLVFAQAEGDYVVAVRRIGFQATTFRLSRTGISGLLGADVYLKTISRELDRVVVSAGKPVPTGDSRAIGELGSSALADSLFLADPSKLMALLMSIPGVLTGDDSTFSVMGAASNQNTTTLDGGRVRGLTLPADALSSTRIVTSSADPSRGGFAGGSISQTLRGGTDIFSATLRGNDASRTMAWQDPEWSSPIPHSMSSSGTAGGPIIKQRLRYNVSWNYSDNRNEWYSLAQPRSALLAQQGIRVDSVTRVTQTLDQLGVQRSVAGFPSDAFRRGTNASGVLDFTPTATSSVRVSYGGNWNTNASGTTLTSFPTRASRAGSQSQFGSARYSGYLHGLLNELNVNGNYYSDYQHPFTTLPSASVRIGTDFDDGRTGLASLGFGGGIGEYYESSKYAGLTDELSWLPKNGKHKLKVGGEYQLSQSKYFYFPTSNLLGNYTYLSTDDLAANKPASYDRVITNTPRNTKSSNSAVWVGEEWKASPAWQMQGGLRFDFAHPGTTPKYNPAVDAAFGVRTDRIPDDVGMSPRVGFSWSSKTRRGQGSAGGSSTLGGIPASEIVRMSPELITSIVSMQRGSTLPGIGVSGTIGAYRGSTSTSTIADLVESTGLPGTRITLSCVGEAVPIPDWSTMTEGPATCADGTTGSSFSIARPLVSVFDPSFRAPLAWRGNVGVDGIRGPHKWIVSVNSGFAYNMNGQSTIDLNLNRTPHFFLAGEDERPVYVPLDAIVPATGSKSPAASRISPEFSTVSSMLSDLRGYNANLSASIAPPNPLFNRRVTVGAGYSYNYSRTQARGSSRVGTAGDPFEKQWIPSSQPAHSFRVSSTGRVSWFNFGVTGYLYSGIPLTPMVQGDINGDGSGSNDRAFIPDPATMSDTALRTQLNELISHAPGAARECLTSQFGKMAGANSCRTPWQARMDVSASVTPPSSWGYNDRLRLTFTVHNASGALVRALGLQNTPLGQTQLSTTPNPTLFYVTGFDPNSQQFKYRVNQLFGEPQNYGSARRRFAPAQLALGLEYRFGGPPLNPLSRGLGLREAMGKAELTDDQRRAAVTKLKRDPVTQYTTLKDSLGLSIEQIAQLSALSHEYATRADSALAPLTKWVIKKGRRVFDQDLGKHLSPAQASLAKLNSEYAKKAAAVLTAAQTAKYAAATATKK